MIQSLVTELASVLLHRDTPPEGAQCQFVLSVTHTDSTSFKSLKTINKAFLFQVWLRQCYFCLPCSFSLFSTTHFNAHRCNVCFLQFFFLDVKWDVQCHTDVPIMFVLFGNFWNFAIDLFIEWFRSINLLN